MKKVALVFVVAVLVPSLVLAWLAVRSLRDQQFLLERQQSLLCQRVTDALAQTISERLAQQQQEFSAQVENLSAGKDVRVVAAQFDDQIRQHWPLAEVGFCVTLSGKILSPPNSRAEAKLFYSDNSAFLGNQETAEVYGLNGSVTGTANNNAQSYSRSGGNNGGGQAFAFNSISAGNAANNALMPAPAPASLDAPAAVEERIQQTDAVARARQSAEKDKKETANQPAGGSGSASSIGGVSQNQYALNYKSQARKVSPQNALLDSLKDASGDESKNLSKVIPAEAEFAQLVGNGTDGLLARFLQNKLNLMFWHRLDRAPDLIFGAQLNLNRVIENLRDLVRAEPALQNEICLALLDDNAKPVAVSRSGFKANWKRPFAATEIGDALPHWEIAAYLVNPAALTQAAHTAKITLGLLIAVLMLAIGVGSWLIVSGLNAELKLARQKTDFVSNVSHELKTPLTSIRMFSELLAEGRVTDAAKQKTYLHIITAEAARLTRLINNVLDFSRLESGEKKYHFQSCDLAEVVRLAAETFRPHLEATGFKFECELPAGAVPVRGDADALAQIIVNLLSNAEKYSNGGKEITLQLAPKQSPLPHAEVRVLDRGQGVPRGSGEKIFEKFYRAHDSLASGIQGSGLGLTIARQIARAHGGDVVYEPREGGGSCFILRLPITTAEKR